MKIQIKIKFMRKNTYNPIMILYNYFNKNKKYSKKYQLNPGKLK